ncbi:MAG TPA: cobalamin biosynthesis protein [Feifaniaceae bacterium]|nr:cobalamin biosynthesis protein [Feifaniaceae bacterium]
MKVGILAFSEAGLALGERLREYFTAKADKANVTRCKDGGLAAWTQTHFASDEALIFIGSAGLAVRAIAPYLKSKTIDPAVIVVDELKTYSISLLSGHLGGANELAAEVARVLGAIHVVTTATDLHGVFAVDTWAKKQGLAVINPERIKWISSRLLAGEAIRLRSKFPVEGGLPKGIELTEGPGDILVTCRTRGNAEPLRLVPPVVTLGVGCKKDTDAETIENAFSLTLAKAGCHPAAVKRVCSIDLKANEPGLLEFCRRRALPYRTFSAGELAAVPGKFRGSAFVKSVTGVDSVCERSAVLGSGAGGKLLTQKDAGHGVTMALAIEPYVLRFNGGEEAE